MIFSEIKPFVRHVEITDDKSASINETHASYDHIFMYVTDGEADIIINEAQYHMENKSMIIIPPGIFFTLMQSDKLQMITVHFDIDDKYSVKRSFYLKPDVPESFNPDNICKNEILTGEECFENVIFENNFINVDEYAHSLYSEFKHREKYYDVALSHLLAIILVKSSRHINVLKTSFFDDQDIVDKVLEYIHQNYARDISNETIAGEFGFHQKHLNRLVKQKTGNSIHKHIIRRRISKSVDLLLNTTLPIYEIADKAGFADTCHFSKCFKSIMGKSPNEYRKNDNM